MGLGLPVVTTSEGLRGLLVRDATEDDGLLVADDPSGQVKCIQELRTDPARWLGSATAARQAAAACNRQDVFDAALARILATAAAMSANRGPTRR
jgi:hypothetical protein